MKGRLKAVRIKQMERYIAEKGFVTIVQLCEHFNVSKNTVRADIAELAEKGVVEKKYGGVAGTAPSDFTAFSERKITNIEKKEQIGRAAARLLEKGDVIFIDSGTTTACLLHAVSEFPEDITIITNNYDAIKKAEEYPNLTVMVLAGKLERKTNSFIGVETIEGIKQYNLNKCFMGTTGISEVGELSNSTLIEAKIKREVIKHSQKVYLMADTKKVGKSVMVNFADLSQIDTWICDDEKETEALNLGEKLGVEVIVTRL